MGVGRIFPSGGNSGFFQGGSGEISFYPVETNKTTFFGKNLIGKGQISKSGGARPPTSEAHAESSKEIAPHVFVAQKRSL